MHINITDIEYGEISMLKKLLSLVVLLLIGWGSTIWYIGYQTQQQLSHSASAKNNLQILHHQKGFNRSQLRFKLTTQTGNTLLNQLFHHVIFNATIVHGPIIYTADGIKIASSHWQVNAEQTSLPKNLQVFIKKLFPNKKPFELNITFNFSDQGHYQLTIPQTVISEFDQQLGSIAPSHFSGMINLSQQTGRIEGKIGEITIKDPNGHLHIPATDVYADSENSKTHTIKRKANLRTEKITYKSDQLANAIYFHLNLHLKQQLNEQSRHSTLDLSISDAITPDKMISSVNMKLAYQEEMEQMEEINKITKRDVVKSSIFQNQQALKKQPIMHTLLHQLEYNNGSLTFSFNIIGDKGQLDLQAQARTTLVAKTKQLKAHMTLNADKHYIDSTPLTTLLTPYIERNVLLVNNNKYQFKASIDGDQALLNGLELLDDVTQQSYSKTPKQPLLKAAKE